MIVKLKYIVTALENHLNREFILSEEQLMEIGKLLNGVSIGFTQNNPDGVWRAELNDHEKAQELPLDPSSIFM